MNESSTKGVYKRLLGYVRPYKGRLICGIIAAMVSGVGVFGVLTAFNYVLTTFFPEVDTVAVSGLPIALTLLAFMSLLGFSQYLGTYFIHWVGYRVVTDLRNEAFAHLQQLDLLWYSKARAGDVISRVSNDTVQVQQAVSTTVSDMVREPFTLIGALGFVVFKLWELKALGASYILLLLPLCVVPVVLLGRHVRRYAKQNQERLAGLVGILQENFSGVRVVKAFGMEGYEHEKFSKENDQVFRRLIKLVLAARLNQPLMQVVAAVSLVFALMYARESKMTSADFFTIAAAFVMMYQPVKRLGRMQMAIEQSSASAKRVFELIDTVPSVQDTADAQELSGEITSVAFDRVSFTYEVDPVLQDLSFEVKAGECYALVGGTGSGKTTMVNLIARFFDPTSGAVKINGRDLREWTVASLRKQVAFVTQDTFLFHDTIARNIAYGLDEPDMERVKDAAKRARATDFIEASPEGYDTIVGDRGATLSGGQRQRLAIARALYRDAPILVLDEATSALDSETERLVQEALTEVMKGRTTFAIAHRLSTIRHANRILVLNGGRIVEQGSHEDLMALGGEYRYLQDLQGESGE